jgi:hypothetical protein
MRSLKHQKGNLLIFAGLLLAALAFYLTLHVESQQRHRSEALISELRAQVNSYLFALDMYGKTYCGVDGVIPESDIYPAFSSMYWNSPFNSSVSFSIDNSTGKRAITLTFPNSTYYELLANKSWEDFSVEKQPGSQELIFTNGRETAPSHGRSNYNRSLFLSATPNGC